MVFGLEYDHIPMRLCTISGRDFTVSRLEYDHFPMRLSTFSGKNLLFSNWNMSIFLNDYVQFRVGILIQIGIRPFFWVGKFLYKNFNIW